jgi:hypothetical protein
LLLPLALRDPLVGNWAEGLGKLATVVWRIEGADRRHEEEMAAYEFTRTSSIAPNGVARQSPARRLSVGK